MIMCLCEFRSGLPFGDFHHDISGRSCSIHGRHNPFHMPSQHGPLWIAEYYDCDCTNRQILLVMDIFVGSEEYFKSSLFGCLQQFPVLEFLPPSLGGRLDFIHFEESTDGDRSLLVKKYEHQRVSAE